MVFIDSVAEELDSFWLFEPLLEVELELLNASSCDWGKTISPTKLPKILTTPKITFPEILLLAKVTTLAATLAAPVTIAVSPPVF